jgi:shikimate kinase
LRVNTQGAADRINAVQATIESNIVLVGLMGAGKTTIGRLLARSFGRPFVDSDHEIEARTGVKVPVIFEIEGEAGFRAREAQVIAELCARESIVLATGGGAVLHPANRTALRASGQVIYLNAQPNDLWQRTRHDQNRPLLRGADPLARLIELYAQRDPLYREVAHLIVETGRQSPRLLAAKLEQQLREGFDQEDASHPAQTAGTRPASGQAEMAQTDTDRHENTGLQCNEQNCVSI